MKKRTDLVPLDPKMNAFHLAVAVHQEQCAFVLDHLAEVDHVALGLLRRLNDDLLQTIELHDAT